MLRQAHLHPVIASRPFDLVLMDYFGPLPATDGHTHVLTIIDKFTRFVRFVPVKHADGPTTVAVLQNFIHDFEVPARIRTDRGSHFANKTVADFLAHANIEHDLSPALHHQAQGAVERVHRDLKTTIKALNVNRHQLWKVVLPAIQHHINTSYNAAIGCSPYQALFGREPRTLLMSLLGTRLPVFQNVGALASAINAWHEYVTAAQQHSFARAKADHDNTVIPISFSNNATVMVYFENPANKLDSHWRGPCVIRAKIHENKYLVCDLSTGREFEAHTNRLQPFDVSRKGVEAALEETLPTDYFIVESVRNHRLHPTLELQLKFKDDPELYWVPSWHLTKVTAVQEYCKARDLPLTCVSKTTSPRASLPSQLRVSRAATAPTAVATTPVIATAPSAVAPGSVRPMALISPSAVASRTRARSKA